MPSVKRETERKVNAPVDTGPSPNSDGRVNNPTEGANEPSRESGSLQWGPVREFVVRGIGNACYGPPPTFSPGMDP
ncbi:hypothetical protein T08_5392, partial [Trichinella sp. T8]